MDIQQVSDNIDYKLVKLEEELKRLIEHLPTCETPENTAVIEQDIRSLNTLKVKLIKSQELAWKAHNLKEEIVPPKEKSYHWLLLLVPIPLILGYLIYRLMQ